MVQLRDPRHRARARRRGPRAIAISRLGTVTDCHPSPDCIPSRPAKGQTGSRAVPADDDLLQGRAGRYAQGSLPTALRGRRRKGQGAGRGAEICPRCRRGGEVVLSTSFESWRLGSGGRVIPTRTFVLQADITCGRVMVAMCLRTSQSHYCEGRLLYGAASSGDTSQNTE